MKKNVPIKLLNDKLQHFKKLENSPRPSSGWVKAVRTTLGISLEQLAKKLGVSKQNVQSMEKREQEMTVTLKSLQELANAMDMKLVYALVPIDSSLDALIDRKASELAKKIVSQTAHNMSLENQMVSEEQLNYALEARKEKIIQEMPKALWD